MTAIPQPTPQIEQLEQPFFDKKTVSLALVGVVALHGIVAVGLANMTIPEIKPPKVTPPLEIVFLKPPPPVEVKPEDIKIEPDPKPIETPIKKSIEPKSEPKAEPKLEKKIEPKPVQQHPKPIEKPIQDPVKETVKTPSETIKEPEKPVVKQPELDQNLIKAKQIAEENERAEQQRQKDLEQEKLRQEQIRQEQQRQKDLAEQQERDRKQAEAEAERKRADDEAKLKAKADADAKAKKEAEDKAKKAKEDAEKQQAQNNTPVTFSVGQASWRRQPKFSCNNNTSGEVLTASIRYVTDKQGNPTSTTLVKSTGNAKFDAQLTMQAKGAKFNPFTKNGVPVIAILTVPIRCE